MSHTEETIISGNGLCLRILRDTGSDVSSLMELVKRTEVQWLEFKATILRPGPGDTAPEMNIRWKFVEAIIALANWQGGAILVGVDDTSGLPIGLELNMEPDEVYNWDNFTQRLSDLLKQTHWDMVTDEGGEYTHTLKQPLEYTPLRGVLHGRDVAVVLVQPVPLDSPIIATRLFQGGRPRNFLLVREKGDQGIIKPIDLTDDPLQLNTHRISREAFAKEEANIEYNRWLRKFQEYASSDEASIKKYLNRLRMRDELREANLTYVELFYTEEGDNSESSDDVTDLIAEEKRPVDPSSASTLGSAAPQPKKIGLAKDIIKTCLDKARSPDKTESLMITGPGGSGKTTLLRHIAFELAEQRVRDKTLPLPIFLRLQDWSQEHLDEDATFTISHLLQIQKDRAEKLLAASQVTLLLDGFDEIASEQARQKMSSKIADLLNLCNNHSIVITSRDSFLIAGYERSFRQIDIQPLDKDQAIQIIVRKKEIEREKAEKLWSNLQKHEVIRRVALRPFVLAILLEMDLATRYESTGQLLRDFTRRVLRREIRRKKPYISKDDLERAVEKVRSTLMEMAFQMVCYDKEDCLSVSSEDLDYCKGAAIGRQVTKESGPCLSFEHDSYRDYFAGEYILKDINKLMDLYKAWKATQREHVDDTLSRKKRTIPIVTVTDLHAQPSVFLRHPEFMKLPPSWRADVLSLTRNRKAVEALAAYCSMEDLTQTPIMEIWEHKVRKASALSLGEINTSEARERLIRLSFNTNLYTRLLATMSLNKVDCDQEVAGRLLDLLMDKNPRVAEKADYILGKLMAEASLIVSELFQCCRFGVSACIGITHMVAAISKHIGLLNSKHHQYLESDDALVRELRSITEASRRKSVTSVRDAALSLLGKFGPAKPPVALVGSPCDQYSGTFWSSPYPGYVECSEFSGPVPCVGCRLGGFSDGEQVKFKIKNWGESGAYVVSELLKVHKE